MRDYFRRNWYGVFCVALAALIAGGMILIALVNGTGSCS